METLSSVLIVEGDPKIAVRIIDKLQSLGVEFLLVAGIDQAFRVLRADPQIRIVFIGLNSEMTGLGLIDRVMADPSLSEIRIILINDSGNTTQMLKAIRRGAVGRISVNPRASEILDLLKRGQKKVV